MRAQHAHFYQQRTVATEIDREPPPTRWKVASLSLALLVTLITFALTSATPPVPPPPPAVIMTGGGTVQPPAASAAPDQSLPNSRS